MKQVFVVEGTSSKIVKAELETIKLKMAELESKHQYKKVAKEQSSEEKRRKKKQKEEADASTASLDLGFQGEMLLSSHLHAIGSGHDAEDIDYIRLKNFALIIKGRMGVHLIRAQSYI